MRASRLAEKGIMPKAGGSEDQTAAAMEGIMYAWSERDRMKERLAPNG